MSPIGRNLGRSSLPALGYLGLMLLSLGLGLYRVRSTGPLWPDGPRYANGGAMVHDWLSSGPTVDVYRFALENYARYPAFSIPYHPPAYPAMLGAWFAVAGVSYIAARAFVAACLGATACLIAMIMRRLGAGHAAAFGCAILWATTPEVVRWSRDTMSEVPSLALMLAASYTFLGWLDAPSPRPARIWWAFALAGLAFLSRVTTVGILPCWFLYASASGRIRRVMSVHVAVASILFICICYGQLTITKKFARHEVVADDKGSGPSLNNLTTFATCLPEAATWGTTALALAGLVASALPARRSRVTTFGLCWLACYSAFKIAVPTSPELRHLFGALPALPLLASGLWGQRSTGAMCRAVAPSLLAAAVAVNFYLDARIPRGVTGYDEVARLLADRDRAGNVLLACPEDQDLIFRYRAATRNDDREMIRADRSLSIRVSDYARVPAVILGRQADDLLKVVREGRVRYLVTAGPDLSGKDRRTEEMVLTHETAATRPKEFRRVETVPLLVQYTRPGRSLEISVWEFLGQLPEGHNNLPVIIPTSGITVEIKSRAETDPTPTRFQDDHQ
jgi:Dolichyl-phosphate-mannose-protein mannosyltransferase